MKVLVTGSSGQIGSYIVEHLRDKADVSGIDLKQCDIHYVNEITVQGDIRNIDDVTKAMKDVDKVVHCAAQVSVAASLQDPLEDASHNVYGTINLLEAAAKAGVSRFVHFSSAAIYGDPVRLPVDEEHPKSPLSPYGASKYTGEVYALSYAALEKVPATAIRPFNVYSRRQDPSNPYSGVMCRFMTRINDDTPPLIYGDGGQTRDFVHVSDVVSMVDKLLSEPKAIGRAFNCATGSAIKINDLASALLEITGKKDLGVQHKDAIPGEIYDSWGDNTKAKELGFTPRTSLEDGLRDLVFGE